MFNSITLGKYYNTESTVHDLDSRVKLILTFVYMVLVFFANNFYCYGALLLFLILIVKLSNIPVKIVLKSLKPVIMILIFTFIINVFLTSQGEIIFQFWIFKIRENAVQRALLLALRLVFLVMGTSIMTLTTSPIALTYAIESVFSPLKVFKFPAHELAMMMSIALRFIPTLLEEAGKIQKAQMARGAKFESNNIKDKALAMVPLLIPLFISAFRRAEELAFAMEARCYHGGEGRTRMNVSKIKRTDIVAICLFVVMFAVVIYISKVL